VSSSHTRLLRVQSSLVSGYQLTSVATVTNCALVSQVDRVSFCTITTAMAGSNPNRDESMSSVTPQLDSEYELRYNRVLRYPYIHGTQGLDFFGGDSGELNLTTTQLSAPPRRTFADSPIFSF
jgi:hypothetical protein